MAGLEDTEADTAGVDVLQSWREGGREGGREGWWLSHVFEYEMGL